MPRKKKCRRICALPISTDFAPLDKKSHRSEAITLLMDEYEAIRLIDYIGLTQEECALQMTVARTTITAIYENARRKIADSLVNGKRLVIEGGEVSICQKDPKSGETNCPDCQFRQCGRCLKTCPREMENNS